MNRRRLAVCSHGFRTVLVTVAAVLAIAIVFAACKNPASSTTTTAPNSRANTIFVSSTHVYIAGWVYPYPVYWVDGVKHQIGTTSGYWAYAVTTSGSDVYAMGADFNSTTYVYWKNDVMSTLSLPAGVSFKYTYGIAAASGHVWVAGVGVNGSGHQVAILWRDGTAIQLPVGSGDTDAGMQGDIIVASNVAYVYGQTWSSSSAHTAIWADDGTHTGSFFATSAGWVTDGAVSGGVAYVSGWGPGTTTSSIAGYSSLTYNGSSISQPSSTDVTDLAGSKGSLADAIAVSGTSVYLAGETNDWNSNGPSLALSWGPTGIPTELPLPSNVSTGSATHIAVAGNGDVYVAGYPVTRADYFSSSNPSTPLLWKNGVPIGSGYLPLPSGDTAAILDSGGAIASSGNDVYLVGVSGTASGSGFDLDYNKLTHAVYWKDGVLTTLPTS